MKLEEAILWIVIGLLLLVIIVAPVEPSTGYVCDTDSECEAEYQRRNQ